MLHPEYRSFEYAGRYEQPDFVRFYEDSGILRARKGHYSYTVMREKSNFLYFHNGTSKAGDEGGGKLLRAQGV